MFRSESITLLVLLVFQAEYCNCINKLEKDLVSNYQSQFEKLFKAEAPTWETHGNLMVMICLKCLVKENVHITSSVFE